MKLGRILFLVSFPSRSLVWAKNRPIFTVISVDKSQNENRNRKEVGLNSLKLKRKKNLRLLSNMTQTIGRVDNPVSFSYHQISYTHYWMVGCSILMHKFLLFCLFSLPAVFHTLYSSSHRDLCRKKRLPRRKLKPPWHTKFTILLQ